MFHVLMNWYKRRFSDPNAVTLFLLLLAGFMVIYFFGDLGGANSGGSGAGLPAGLADSTADATRLRPNSECNPGALPIYRCHAAVADWLVTEHRASRGTPGPRGSQYAGKHQDLHAAVTGILSRSDGCFAGRNPAQYGSGALGETR